MRLPREIFYLLVLLLCAMGSVLWYVLARRSGMHASPAVVAAPAEPASAARPKTTAAAAGSAPAVRPGAPAAGQVVASPVDLTKHDGQTIDFSSGQAVVRQSPADQAALAAGLKDIAEATKTVTFGPPPKDAVPATTPAPAKP